MIDFRYHIVSIVSVFLALGLGILLGSSVLQGALPDRLESDLRRSRAARDDAQRRAEELADGVAFRDRLLSEEIAPWVVDRRLEGRAVLFVSHGETGRWTDDVRNAILRAGATPAGNLVVTDRWDLRGEGVAQQLVEDVIRPIVPSFEPGPRPAESALTLVGQRLPEPTGQALVDGLVQAGFVVAEGRTGDQPWPPRDVMVVVLAGDHARTAPQPAWLAAFALGAAEVTGTVVVSGEPDDQSAVSLLRRTDAQPRRLSTFDSAATDPGGIGVVSAAWVAVSERGGHFGRAPDHRFVPQPA